jgi:hypothetical protein
MDACNTRDLTCAVPTILKIRINSPFKGYCIPPGKPRQGAHSIIGPFVEGNSSETALCATIRVLMSEDVELIVPVYCDLEVLFSQHLFHTILLSFILFSG